MGGNAVKLRLQYRRLQCHEQIDVLAWPGHLFGQADQYLILLADPISPLVFGRQRHRQVNSQEIPMQMAYQSTEQRNISRRGRVVFVGLAIMAVAMFVDYGNRPLIVLMPRVTTPLVGVDKGGRQNPPCHHKR